MQVVKKMLRETRVLGPGMAMELRPWGPLFMPWDAGSVRESGTPRGCSAPSRLSPGAPGLHGLAGHTQAPGGVWPTLSPRLRWGLGPGLQAAFAFRWATPFVRDSRDFTSQQSRDLECVPRVWTEHTFSWADPQGPLGAGPPAGSWDTARCAGGRPGPLPIAHIVAVSLATAGVPPATPERPAFASLWDGTLQGRGSSPEGEPEGR